jgi:glycosyltransferase involved in cell wall biosynthesis
MILWRGPGHPTMLAVPRVSAATSQAAAEEALSVICIMLIAQEAPGVRLPMPGDRPGLQMAHSLPESLKDMPRSTDDEVDIRPSRPEPHFLAGRRLLFVVNVDWFFLSHRLPLALAAKAAGADVWVTAADTGRAGEIRDCGMQFAPLGVHRHQGGITGEVRTLVELAILYRRIRPDIVHHITIKPVLYGSLVSRVLRIPTINAISGFGYALGSEGSRALSAVVRALYRIVLRSPGVYTIFQNEEDRAEFTSRRFLPASRAVLIRGSGVDCQAFRPATGCPLDRRVIFASRMLREKGVEYFVRAARSLIQTHPGTRFVLIGEPDDSPSSVTARELRAWHDEGVIEWWGRRSDMDNVLPTGSIFVLPTYYREGLPKVLLEAAACGLPIVTTDVPGCRDVVRHGQNGLLVAPHDQNGLTAAIAELLDDPAARRRLGAKGRERALAEFDVQGVAEQTLSLYAKVLVR